MVLSEKNRVAKIVPKACLGNFFLPGVQIKSLFLLAGIKTGIFSGTG
ncbi:MAG: hypothetical protein IPP73_15470 [Chitinophagaceae bacterium]|nr:hypothetical protein [Chitinophagaceae bacterium]